MTSGCRLCGKNDTVTHIGSEGHRLRAALAHVTGVAPDAIQHYWPANCGGCRDAALLVRAPQVTPKPRPCLHFATVCPECIDIPRDI